MAAAQPFALEPGEGRAIDLGESAMYVRYFDDLASALGRDRVGEDGLDAIACAHAMEIVGPPSERYL
jgi:hypothetical protein